MNKKETPEGYHYMPNGVLMKNSDMKPKTNEENSSYTPLLIIIGLILLTCLEIGFRSSDYSWMSIMSNFMAGFFIVFAGFKLLDLRGFADGYQTYDILAKRSRLYALAFPFIELSLGLGYISIPQNIVLNIAAFVILTFSAIGVIKSLLNKSEIKCSCLGTALNIPLGRVTVIENVSMALMALVMVVRSFI